jgi:predicted DNA-binding antitoxin AbrB/MazE fold protein
LDWLVSGKDGDVMDATKVYPQVRAVHHDGVLELLDPLELPEGAQVRVLVQFVLPEATEVELVYPTRLVPAERLNRLTGLVELGGDALSDSEALCDPDRGGGYLCLFS